MAWSTMRMEERRTSRRFDISFPLECNVLPTSKYFYTVSKDLSVKGIRIVCDKFLQRNHCLRVDINLIDKIVNAKAKVSWCNQQGNTERYVAGLEFVELNRENKEIISKFLSSLS
jgi:c-di-GMP-binding flagellar brake protein YcgR